jgi:5'-3' exonuclease
MPPQNFILYKTLLGDNSDKVKGVKGLGEKGLLKKFPELAKKEMTLDDIYSICEQKYKDHVVYARVIQHIDELEKNYKIMDLSNPMLDKNDKKYLSQVVKTNEYEYLPEQFVAFYNEDKLGGMIRNVEFWVKDIFEKLKL